MGADIASNYAGVCSRERWQPAAAWGRFHPCVTRHFHALGAGALLVGVYDPEQDLFVTVTKIGTGLSDEQWRGIRERTRGLEVDHRPARVSSLIEPSVWLEPQIVIEVLADEITRSPIHTAGKVGGEPGYALRFPRLIAFRERDKKPEDATTVQELIDLYRRQGKK
jgi:DNA ligase-1